MKNTKNILCKVFILMIACTMMLSGCKSESLSFKFYEFVETDTKFYAIESVTGVELDQDLELPAEHNGYPVTIIFERAFEHCEMRYVSMKSIDFIYPEAFWHCRFLETADLGQVKVIEYSAFAHCYKLTHITIPATCRKIEGGAFRECMKLSAVYFCGEPEKIAPDAFEKGVTIYGAKGSKVEAYARENGFKFSAWEAPSSERN